VGRLWQLQRKIFLNKKRPFLGRDKWIGNSEGRILRNIIKLASTFFVSLGLGNSPKILLKTDFLNIWILVYEESLKNASRPCLRPAIPRNERAF
jgi:hypothetical protein